MSLNTTKEINACEYVTRKFEVPLTIEYQATSLDEAKRDVTNIIQWGVGSLARMGGDPHHRYERWRFDEHMGRNQIINVATATANMMDGLLDGRKINDITEAWNMGFLELTQRLAEVAIYGEHQIMALDDDQEFPGVYDYEVSHYFGTWFGKELVENGTGAVEFKKCCAKLDEMREEYFSQNYERWYLLHDTVRIEPLGRHVDFESASCKVDRIGEAGFAGPTWIVDEGNLRLLRDNILKALK